MAGQKPSPDQQAIIDNKTENILVPAAAGSGKTTVMIERIITKIIEDIKDDSIPEERKHSFDSILVVTFTIAAAEHMREKAEEALNKAIRENAGDTELIAKLNRQKDLLPNSYIQTFDSFCARVVREKGYCAADSEQADVFDPANIVLDEHEKEILKKEAVKLAIKQTYAEVKGEDDPFIKLTRRYGDGRTDDSLMDVALEIYDKLRSLPKYRELICSEVERCKACDAAGKLDHADKAALIIGDVIDYLNRKKAEIEDPDGLMDYFRNNSELYIVKTGKKPVDKNENTLAFLSRVVSLIDKQTQRHKADPGADGFEQAFEIISEWKDLFDNSEISYMNGKSTIMKEDPALLEEYSIRKDTIKSISNLICSKPKDPKGIYKAAPKEMVELFAVLQNGKESLLKLQKDRTEATEAMVGLLLKLDAAYSELKAKVRGMDFSDQEYAAYDILESEDAAHFYQEKFVEIFIDEYQDNTRLQDEIISKISREEGNVFRVGDVKQSIYRFRHAEPWIFNEKIDQYKADGTLGKVLPLTENYRSSPQVLAFVNHIFEQAMTRNAAEIDYGPDQRLNHPEVNGAPDMGEAGLPKIVIVDSEGAGKFDGMNAEDDDSDSEDGDYSDGEDYTSAPSGSGDPGDSEEQPLDGKIKALCLGVEKEIREYMSSFDPDSSDYEKHYEDVYVLTTIKSEAEVISNYLNSHGLPSAGRVTTSIFGDHDIRGIINCIICLGNSLRNEYLVGVLLSPYKNTNFTVNEIAAVQAFIMEKHLNLRKEYLFEKLRWYAAECSDDLGRKIKEFIDWFDDLRMKAMTCDIDEIIEMIYKQTDIKATVSFKEGNFEKLLIFKDWMSSNFKRFGCDIAGVAGELENMRIQINTAAIESGINDKNRITCMNFHKSKGLEKPFVIFALKDRGKGESIPSAGFDPKFGFFFEDYNADKISRSKSLDQCIYRFDNVLAENAEVLRDLYVTLTRAQTKLSIVTWNSSEKPNPSISKAAEVAGQATGDSFKRLDWLASGRTMSCDMFMCLLRTDSSEAEKIRQAFGAEIPNLLGFTACTTKKDQTPGFVFDNKGYTVEIFDKAESAALDLTMSQYSAGIVLAEDKKHSADDLFDGSGKQKYGHYKYDSLDEDGELNEEESVTYIPFKVSVTGIKHGNLKETSHVDLEVPSLSDFENYGSGDLTAATKGTLLHKMMRFIDTARLREDPDSFDSEVGVLIKDGLFAEYSEENVRKCAEEFRKGILAFASSEVCEAADESDANGNAEREKHLVFAIPATTENENDFALVQGIIDLVYLDGDGWVIVDYKTDGYDKECATKEERAVMAKAKHAFQLDSYAAAFDAAGRKVSKKLLYLVRYGEFVEV